MPTKPGTSIFIAPDGTARVVPESDASKVAAAGWKHAVKMIDPTGKGRAVPDEDVAKVLAANWKVAQDQPSSALTFLKNFADSSGLSTLGSIVAHPLNDIKNLATMTDPTNVDNPIRNAVSSTVQNTVEEGKAAVDAAKQGQYGAAAAHAVQAVPVVGQVTKQAGEEIPSTGDNSYTGLLKAEVTDPATMGTIAGAAASPAVAEGVGRGAGAIAERVPSLSNGANAMRLAKERFNRTVAPKDVTLTPHEEAANDLVKSFNPPVGKDGKIPDDIMSSAEEVPHVKAIAAKNGITINGKRDFGKVAGQEADAIQSHLDDVFTRPHSGKFMSVPADAKVPQVRPGVARISDVYDRINAIDELQNNGGQITSQAKQRLRAEGRQLKQGYYSNLDQLNDVDPGTTADLRQRAGKLRTLRDQAEMSAQRDSSRAASADQEGGGGKFRLLHMADDALANKIVGTPEVVGNRLFKGALDKFSAEEKPLPQPAPPDPATTATTPEAAQREFLRSQELEQGSQDAAAARGGIADEAREGNRAASFQARTGRTSPVDKDVVTKTMTQPSPTAGQTTPPIALPAPSADVAPPTATPTPGRATTESKQVVAPDAARGVQPVNMDVTSPATHIFSKSAAAKAAPGTDVNAAAAAAKADGYEVVE